MKRSALQRRAIAAVVLGLAIGSGALAMAAWTTSGNGTGYSKATSASPLALGDASGATTADLYPGATGTAYVQVTNPNPYPVTVTSAIGNGAITSNKGSACNASTGVTYTDQTGLSQVIAPGATSTIALPGAVAMSNGSDNSCQGAIFSIPVTVSGTS
jgi:hypothetical protein